MEAENMNKWATNMLRAANVVNISHPIIIYNANEDIDMGKSHMVPDKLKIGFNLKIFWPISALIIHEMEDESNDNER